MRSLEDTKDLRVGTRLKALMMGAGLVDVDARMIPLPLSAWSGGKCAISFHLLTIADTFSETAPDPRMREIGMANRENVKRLFSALAHYPLTQRQRMPQEEFQALVTEAAHEADNPRIKAYFPV